MLIILDKFQQAKIKEKKAPSIQTLYFVFDKSFPVQLWPWKHPQYFFFSAPIPYIECKN